MAAASARAARLASPLLRTRQTAQPVAEALDLQIHPDERVIEPWNHFEGLHVDAAELAKPVHWPHLIDPLRPSWGEPYERIAARMLAAIDSARTAVHELYDGGEIVPQPGEIEDARWFNVNELPLIPPPFTSSRRLLDEALARL